MSHTPKMKSMNSAQTQRLYPLRLEDNCVLNMRGPNGTKNTTCMRTHHRLATLLGANPNFQGRITWTMKRYKSSYIGNYLMWGVLERLHIQKKKRKLCCDYLAKNVGNLLGCI
jgi:hypothetical protein